MNISKLEQPIYVTRPLMPSYDLYTEKLKDIWSSKWLSNQGPQHIELEDKLKAYLDVDHLSLFNNGTTALTVAIQALRLQGEVITTPFSFPATTHALTWNGITPVFCDIDPHTMTIDPTKIEGLITSKTSAILGVHVYGIPCHVEEIERIADRHGLKVIYDGAHSFGAMIDDKPIGSFGDITMFSFHPTKLFHTSEGGALVCADENLKQRIDLLKNFGIKNETEVIMPGINGKMNEMSALMGLCVLDIVDGERDRRAQLRQLYLEGLANIPGVSVVAVQDNVINSQQYMVIRINEDEFGQSRDQTYDNLKSYNILARKYFFPLISDYPCYKQLPTAAADRLENSTVISNQVLCLPFYGELKDSDIEVICQVIKSKRSCYE
jgi:dTDP-4-amino-4,6-dideoxygalactose transaminase